MQVGRRRPDRLGVVHRSTAAGWPRYVRRRLPAPSRAGPKDGLPATARRQRSPTWRRAASHARRSAARGVLRRAPPHISEDLCSVVDAANGLRQAVSSGERGGGRRNRRRHQCDRRVQPQERETQETGTYRCLDECPLGEASVPIDGRYQRRASGRSVPARLHDAWRSARRRSDEIAALAAVSATTPPATRPVFTTLSFVTPPLSSATESPTLSTSPSGSLFVPMSLMTSLLVLRVCGQLS